jgi:A/G-specific adenine glycosylase
MERITDFEVPAMRRALLRWHRRHAQPAPWRESRDAYHALVAAVMAQQTQMSRVIPKYTEFIDAFPTVHALAAASPSDVLRAWASLGYNMRALRLHRAARRIVEEGAFPRSAAELEEIDGVGPFTAAIISSFAFGEPVVAVDTNVCRIIERLTGRANGETQAIGAALISRRAPGRWNQAMMDLGALVCMARSPKCDQCPIANWCRTGRHSLREEGRRAADAASSDGTPARAAESRATYRVEAPFKHSRRYYRGRIVEVLRALPAGRSVRADSLFARVRQAECWPSEESLGEIVKSLERDGLVRVTSSGRVRLP